MKPFGRDRGRRLTRAAVGSLLAGILVGLAGCDAPEKGTVQVAPEARERLLPHAGASKDGTPGKSLSIKDRIKRAPSSP